MQSKKAHIRYLIQGNRNYTKLINTQRWTNLRNKKLKANPLCEECLKDGVYTPATEVHHRIPVDTYRTIDAMRRVAYDYGNLESICHECHKNIHRALFYSRTKNADRQRVIKEDVERFKSKYL